MKNKIFLYLFSATLLITPYTAVSENQETGRVITNTISVDFEDDGISQVSQIDLKEIFPGSREVRIETQVNKNDILVVFVGQLKVNESVRQGDWSEMPPDKNLEWEIGEYGWATLKQSSTTDIISLAKIIIKEFKIPLSHFSFKNLVITVAPGKTVKFINDHLNDFAILLDVDIKQVFAEFMRLAYIEQSRKGRKTNMPMISINKQLEELLNLN